MGPVFTVGHSNHGIEKFLDLLEAHRIDVVVDVRSQPYSRYTPHFNYSELPGLLQSHQVRYLYLGRELGGRPEDPDFYDPDGNVLYGRFAESDLFQSGIARLVDGLGSCRMAVMCAEEDPAECHRHLLITRVLLDRGIAVEHIRADGRLEAAGAEPEPEPQLALFDYGTIPEWKSTPSALRKRLRSTSSPR